MHIRPTVDRRFLQNVVDAMTRLGIDLRGACVRDDLARRLNGECDRIDLALVAPLYELATRESGNPAWLYRAVNEASFAGAGTLFQLLGCCENLFDAFRLGCRYSSVATDVCSFDFHDYGTCIDLRVTPNPDVRVSLEQLEFVFIPSRYQQLAPAQRSPVLIEATFTHGPRFPIAAYTAHFGCPVRFYAPHNGLRLSHAALETPLVGANVNRERHFRAIAEHYERNTLAIGTLVS